MTWLVELQGLNLYMTEPHEDGYKITARANGRDWGNPQAVIDAIQSQLTDGSLAKIGHFDNRPITLRVKIEAPGAPDPGAVLAKGELALFRATRWAGYGVLRLRPDMPGAITAVAEIVTGYPDLETTDAYIENSPTPYRIFQLTLNARPFVRPETRVKIEAPAVLPTTPNDSTVDPATSATGWSLLTATPPVVHNFVTDPVFASGLSGWGKGTGADTVTNPGGLLRVAGLATPTNTGAIYANSPAYPVTAGTTYYFGLTVYRGKPGLVGQAGVVGMMRRWYNAAGAQIGVDSAQAVTIADRTAYSFAAVETAPPGATSMRLFPYAARSRYTNPFGGIGDYFWTANFDVDNAYVDDGNIGLFNGTTSDTPARNYAWTGTANASVSTMSWTTATIAPVSGALQVTMWGRRDVSVRRTGAVNMTAQPYLRLTGQAYWDVNGTHKTTGLTLTFTVDGNTVNPDAFTISATGDWQAILHLPNGVANTLDVTATGVDSSIPDSGLRLRVGPTVKTDRPIPGTGRAQVRQVPIVGAMRTEVSLLIEGRDDSGDPTDVGPQVLVATASAGDDQAAKFITLRQYGPTGTSDPNSIGGSYTALNTIVGTPLAFEFPVGIVTRGNYRVFLEVQPNAAGPFTIFHRATVVPTGQPLLAASDPVAGWKQVPLVVGATYPAVPLNTYRLIPLQLMAFPPGDVEGDAKIRIELTASAGGVIRVGEGIAVNVTAGQVTLLDTSGGVSAVRLDAATVDNPDPTIWIGAAGGTMVQAPMTRIQSFGVHQAEPPYASIGSVTPNCGTSLLSAEYFDRYHSHVAPRDASTVQAGA